MTMATTTIPTNGNGTKPILIHPDGSNLAPALEASIELARSRKADAAVLEKVLLVGDLARLSPDDRLRYYRAVCDSLGLNPLTKPFAYITLNNKLTLYATKDCTEQLRKRDNISISIVARDLVDGVYVVTARATKTDGRADESIGAVPIGNLDPVSKANAMMKAETKAKRRVTLSVSGLGLLDESEVESIPDARRYQESESAQQPAPPAKNEPAATPAAEPIAQQQAQNITTPARKPWSSFGQMVQCFQELKNQIPWPLYYNVLADFGVHHANEFKRAEIAWACFQILYAKVQEYLRAAKDPTTFENFEVTEGDWQ